MSELQGDIRKTSPTAELEIINRKRAALKKLVQITTTLNRLHQGLQSVILMGKSSADIPGIIIEKFHSFREKLDPQPTEKLKNTLSSTEQKINSDVKRVLEISQKSNEQLSKNLGGKGDKLLASLDDNLHDYANDFKKKGQTSIALRIALKARNVVIRAFKLPVPESFIEQQISILDRRELECRHRINTDIDDIQSDIRNLMAREDCPEELRDSLVTVARNLSANRDHIAAGKQIEDMPILYESIEVSAAPHIIEELEEQSRPTEEVIIEAPPASRIKRSFSSRLSEWLRSPMNVKWKDIKKYK